MLGDALDHAIRYWEPRRLAYNLALAVLASAWVLVTWPHFRAALTFESLSPDIGSSHARKRHAGSSRACIPWSTEFSWGLRVLSLGTI